ncbi:hypothetical protein [Chitinivorax sp. B]|uniref:hypothetical protein n=1 Tax=Chitinivorax sp. B TaxID=2502235 RepID=UPI00148559D3|nr:hypothetical protein [Chitinivorax sp. B]
MNYANGSNMFFDGLAGLGVAWGSGFLYMKIGIFKLIVVTLPNSPSSGHKGDA